MPRSVVEWIGKTPDSKPPPRVRLRVFRRETGRCYLTGRKIMPGDKWELDHKKALILGGLNVESNLAPVLVDAHKAKTAEDVAVKAKTDAVASKHIGIRKAKRPMPGSRASKWKKLMDGTTVRR